MERRIGIKQILWAACIALCAFNAGLVLANDDMYDNADLDTTFAVNGNHIITHFQQLRQLIDTMAKQLHSKIDGLKNEVQEVNNKVDVVKEEVQEVNNKVDVVKDEIQEVNNKVEEINNKTIKFEEFSNKTIKFDEIKYKTIKFEEVQILNASLEDVETSTQYSSDKNFSMEGCGGLVFVDRNLENIFYEPSGGFVPNLRCVWTLLSAYDYIDIFIDNISSTAGVNGLVLYYFDSNATTTLQRRTSPNSNQRQYRYRIHREAAYILFSSDNVGRGSAVRFAVRGSSYRSTWSHDIHHLTNSSGSFSMKIYKDVVVQSTYAFFPGPNTRTRISITSLDLQDGYAYLRVFTLVPYHGHNGTSTAAKSYNGYHPFGPPNSETNTTEARLYILDGKGRRQDRVDISWTAV